MKVFVTGNLGYLGTVLNKILLENYPSSKIIGYDTGFFAHCLIGADYNPDHGVSIQYFGDIRDISLAHLNDIDVVIHLAGLSNDPIGKEFEAITSDINREASVRLARLSVQAGVKNFVFASSCSIYGYADGSAKKETDPANPLTAYARSKIGTENDICELDLESMIFTSLRFATACGWSNRLRLDLVLNDFVACAISSREITVLSDGSPIRPLIDVEDMSRAIVWAMTRDTINGGQFLIINTGSDKNNFQVKDLANEVKKQILGTSITINSDALIDKRSYAVDFSLYKKMAPNHQPKILLQDSIKRLYNGLLSVNFINKNFRQSSFNRLFMLKNLILSKKINSTLRWINFI
jgi:nucleoside-diphosphate-sugar epimerase